MTEKPSILHDPVTGRPILMAPHRQNRTIHTAVEPPTSTCPFCTGNEGQTPEELTAVRPPDTEPGSPGWSVRAFANLYPAAAFHEVVAEGAAHEERPGALGPGLWEDALKVWVERMRFMESHDDVASTFWFKNVGRMAGASVAHNHSQILGLPMVPPRLVLEREQVRRLGYCPFCAALDNAEDEGRLVHRNEHYALLCPAVPKLPFETWLLPLDHSEAFDTLAHIESLALALDAAFSALDGGFEMAPFNMYLHRIPGDDFHWHFEVQPRTGYLAGLELGADMYINAVPARQAAERLRRGLANAAG